VSWTEAQDYCCKLDMRLISVPTLSKIRFFSNYSKSIFIFKFILFDITPKKLKVHYRDFVGEFWTSGKTNGTNFLWTGKDKIFDPTETKWKEGEPFAKGDCVFLQLVNSTENTFLATDNCAELKKFICEVFMKIKTLFCTF